MIFCEGGERLESFTVIAHFVAQSLKGSLHIAKISPFVQRQFGVTPKKKKGGGEKCTKIHSHFFFVTQPSVLTPAKPKGSIYLKCSRHKLE